MVFEVIKEINEGTNLDQVKENDFQEETFKEKLEKK